MTTHDHRTTRAVLDAKRQRADHRQVGELVRYPQLHGDEHITAVGIVEQIICITPDLPYQERTLEFTLAVDHLYGIVTHGARREKIRVNVGYTGIESLG